MLAQLRQIGVPNAHQTNASVRRYLKRASDRTETLLSRAQLPRPATLLSVFVVLQENVQQAYEHLPIKRLLRLQHAIHDMHAAVERGAYFGRRPNGTTRKALLALYQDIVSLQKDLVVPSKKQAPSAPQNNTQIRTFLKAAAERGWKVPAVATHKPLMADDDLARACSYLRKISVRPDRLLGPETTVGVVTAPILVLSDTPIAESILVEWTQTKDALDVYVVFGTYVVIPTCLFLGMTPDLVAVSEENGTTKIDVSKFTSAATDLENQGLLSQRDLIRYPRRVLHHYYCPVLPLRPQHKKYFNKWDMLWASTTTQNTTRG